MDFSAFKQQLLQHYVEMSTLPWAKAAAWHSVNDLAQRYPSEFKDLPELLTEAMRKRKETADAER